MLLVALASILAGCGNKIRHYENGSNSWDYIQAKVTGENSTEYYNAALEEGRTAPLKFCIFWNASKDYDLVVVEPNGNKLYHANATDNGTRGKFHGDSFGGVGSSECITFRRPMAGRYDVFVKVTSSDPEAEPAVINYVMVNGDGFQSYTYELKMIEDVEYYNLTSFDFDGQYVETVLTAEYHDYSPGETVDGYYTTEVSEGGNWDYVERTRNLPGSNNLKIALFWDGDNDLDLIINNPTGRDVYYAQRRDGNRGQHHGDDTGHGLNNKEYASWSNPDTGLYDVFVRVRGVEDGETLPVTLVVLDNGDTSVYRAHLFLPEGEDYSADFRLAQLYR